MDVISQLHEENVRLEAEIERLRQRPLGDPEIGLEIARLEINKLGNECGHLEADKRELEDDLADARKAALSLYRALLYDDLSRDEMVAASLEKWPWLGISETGRAESSTSDELERE